MSADDKIQLLSRSLQIERVVDMCENKNILKQLPPEVYEQVLSYAKYLLVK